MTLRAYQPDDLDAVHAINQGAVPAVGSETRGDLAAIGEMSAIALVADIDDTIAGFCFLLAPGAPYRSMNYRWFSARYRDFVYLDRVAFAPAFQRRGLGRTMYVEVERVARLQRPAATHFTLEVNLQPRNDASLGFVEVGQQQTDYGALVSLMARAL